MGSTLPRTLLVCLAIGLVLAGCTGPGPQDLRCTSDSRGNHLTWSPLPNATGYDIYRSDNTTPNSTVPTLVGNTTETSFTDTNVTPGVNYTYDVTGWNDTGQTSPTTCSVVSVPFFGSPLALGAAAIGAALVVGVVIARRRR